MKRGDKIYLDKECTKESGVNTYLACRDGVVEMYSYRDCSGYGDETKLYLCTNHKHEHCSIIRQVYNDSNKEYMEEELMFDTDSFELLEALIKGNKNHLYGKYIKIRDYNENN